VGCGKPANKAAEAKPAVAKEAEHKEGAGEHAEKAVIKLSNADAAAAGVKTAKVAEETVRASITLSATIQPNRDRYAHVAPRVPGRILEVPAKAGDIVRAGQVLALLDSVEVGESTSAYQQAASQFNVSRADFDRSQKLFDEEVIPQKDYLRARAEFEKSRAALAAASDKLRMMGVKPGTGAAASTLPITSPFAGTVIEKSAVIGELAQVDKSLFTVADLSTVWIEANLYEKDLARVQAGREALVTVSAYPDVRFKGKLAYISAVVDRESRTVKARIEVPNKDGRLKPEMFASAVVQGESQGRAISVPAEAVVLMDNRNAVFVKEADGYEVRPVELGDAVGGRHVIKSGLNVGEEVVVAGTYVLKSQQQKSKIGAGHAH
jgi:cobalt-zinc-cadmium efflux system membrane fusion protein